VPESRSLSLMCSYLRSCLGVHVSGMAGAYPHRRLR
jgi:hypothetical protein